MTSDIAESLNTDNPQEPIIGNKAKKPSNRVDRSKTLTVKPNTRQKQIPIEDIISYKAKNLSNSDIASLLGCSTTNITNRLNNADIQGLNNYKQYKDVAFEHLQRKINNTITDDKLKQMTGLQSITGIAILQDKIQTLRGQASDITEYRVISATLAEATDRMRKAGLLRDDPIEATI